MTAMRWDKPRSSGPVGLTAMGHADHKNHQAVVDYGVDDAIVADPHAPQSVLTTAQHGGTRRPRVHGEELDGAGDP